MADITEFPIATTDIESPGGELADLRAAFAQLASPVVVLSGTSLTISKLYTFIGAFATGVTGDSFNALTVIALPDLTVIAGSITLNMSSLTSLDLSSLVTLAGNWSATLSSLPSLNLSALTTIKGSFSGNMASLTSLDLSSLITVGIHFNPGLASLPSLDLSALVSTGGDLDIYSEEMTTLTLTSALKKIGGIVSLEMVGKHTQASIDNILVRLAALDGTNGTTSFDNKTVDLSGGTNATPSATGLTAKATLEGRGNTVTVN